ncbi:MAG: hypothetical protein C4337_04110 [Armatimonadota bacterium]
MKRLFAFSAVVAVLVISASAQQVRIYDTVWSADGPPTANLPGLTFTGGLPRYTMGDGIGVSLSTPTQLTRFDFVLVVATAVTNASVQFTIDFYNKWVGADVTSSAPAFADPAGSVSGVVSGITTTGATAFIVTITPNSPIILDTYPNKGVVIKLQLNNTASNDVTVGITDRLPSPGTEGLLPDAFYRDVNGDGIIQQNEARTFSGRPNDNLAMALWVPEPASMIALGTGLAGLLAMRRRKW